MAKTTASYLALPRPWDALVKAQLMTFGYVLVRLTDDPADAQTVPAVLVAWAAFELGAYQARYLLNDLADADLDRQHVAADVRGRLPPGAAARRAAIAVLVGRLAAAACAIALLPARARSLTAAAVAVLAAISLVYEGIRAPMRRGRQSPRSGLAVIALVGSGYALRLGFGVALAGGDPGLVAAAAMFAWPLGTMGVVMFWVLEAARLSAHGDTQVLARKPHLAMLSRMIEDLDRPLLRGAPARLTAGLAAAASTTGLLFGQALAGDSGAGGIGTERLAVLLVVCGLAAPLLLAAWSSPWAGAAALLLAGTAPVVLGAGAGIPTAVLMVMVMIWAAGGRASAPPWPPTAETRGETVAMATVPAQISEAGRG